MAEKVAKVGVDKEPGYLYFVDRAGDISCVKMARGRKGRAGKPKKVANSFTYTISGILSYKKQLKKMKHSRYK